MPSLRKKYELFEWIWWGFSLLLLLFILFPLRHELPLFPLLTANVLFVLLGFHYLRLAIWWRYTPLFFHKKWRIALGFAAIPSIFYFVNRINDYIYYKDDGKVLQLFFDLPFDESVKKLNYLNNEFLFLGVTAVLAGIFFSLRMFWSAWQYRKWETEETDEF